MVILNEELKFPDPKSATPGGLLAIGGDLKPERLLLAYRSGIFPWFREGGSIYWFCPPQRLVLIPGEIRISGSMKQVINSKKFSLTEDRAFSQVIRECSLFHETTKGGTWIDEDFIAAYVRLHELGHAHSIEIWENKKLIGGLYGVAVGKIFCGESMFSKVSNASKLALIHLCQKEKYSLIDCQVPTEHLISMGAKTISRDEFLKWVKKSSG